LTFSSTYFPDPINHNNRSPTVGRSSLIRAIFTIDFSTS
jgi:hypothetical protein